MSTGYEKAFSLTSLTAAINVSPFKPYRLGQLGIFEEMGVAQTIVKVEQLNGSLAIVGTAPRGASGQVFNGDKRKELTFSIPHIPALAGLDADELQNIRQFGSEATSDSVIAARDRLVGKMRAGLELTIEAHRIGALKGLVLDKDGSTLIDLFTSFGVTQQTTGMALTTAGTVVRKKVAAAIVQVETALGGVPYSGLRALCGVNFFDELASHPNVEKFWINTPAAQGFAQADPYQAIQFAGVTWERYRGVSGCTIGDDDAYLVPSGIPGLFITRYAPANYIETVNTIGLPMYAKSETRDMGKGYDIEAQTNPLNLCTRPNAIVKLTKV
jgi:hypothetical protein